MVYSPLFGKMFKSAVVVLVLLGSCCLEGVLCNEEDLSLEDFENINDVVYQMYRADNVESYRNLEMEYLGSIMNLSADPCDDFYRFACGNWDAVAAKGVKRKKYSNILWRQDTFAYVLSKLFEEPISLGDAPYVVKLKKFYQSCVDPNALDQSYLLDFINSLGSWPLMDDDWNAANFDWINLTAQAHLHNVDVNWQLSVVRSSENREISRISPSDMLALRMFFEKHNISSANDYVRAVKKVFSKLNVDLTGKEIMLRELFQFQRTMLDSAGNPTPHRKARKPFYQGVHSLREFQNIFRNVNFTKYYRIVTDRDNIPMSSEIIADKMPGLRATIPLVQGQTPRIKANHILVSIVLRYMEGTQGLRTKTPKNVKKTCTQIVTEKMVSAALALYVREYHDDSTAETTDMLTQHIFEALDEMITNIKWLDDTTRANALAKLHSITRQVDFDRRLIDPGKLIEEYAALDIEADKFMKNIINVSKLSMQQQIASIGTIQWRNNPFDCGAAYQTDQNILHVPLGRLQPPAFHKYNGQYMNYGGIGTVIGHELSHAFGPGAVKIDANGVKRNWFSRRAKLTYLEKLECYVGQYNQAIFDDEPVDGRKTLNENFADNQGLAIAVAAYKKWQTANPKLASEVGFRIGERSFTNMQSLFIGYAQLWCGKMSDLELATDLVGTTHAPNEVRVRLPLVNTLEFEEAYNCPRGSTMNPGGRCDHLH